MNGSGPGLFEAVIESWRLVIGNAAVLARIAFVPFLLFLALHRLEAAYEPEGVEAIMAWSLLFTVLPAVPAVMLLMPWYRMLLKPANPALATRPVTWWSIVLMLRWAGLDTMFFVGMAPVMAMSLQVISAGGDLATRPDILVFQLTMIVIGSYLFYGRMGLALPAAAAESDHSYRQSWTMTRDNGWRIGFAIIVCWLPLQFLVSSLREPLVTEDPTLALHYLDAVLGALLRTVNELLVTAVYVQFYLARTAPPLEGEW